MSPSDAEERLEALTEEVRRLADRVAKLEAVTAPPATLRPAASPDESSRAQAAPGTDAPWGGGASTVLSRTALVCFVLVVALVLRTLADAGILGPGPGTALGLGYAGLLLGWGWLSYPRRPPVASLVAVCGALLLCAVVLEAAARLGALSPAAAYAVLGAAGGALALLGRRGLTPAVCAGVPALLLCAFVLAYREPALGGPGAVVFTAFLAAESAGLRPRCAWLSWLAVAATAGLWWGWAAGTGGAAVSAAGPWVLPLLGATAVLHLGAALRRAWSPSPPGAGLLGGVLPVLTVAWAFPAAAAYAPGDPWLGIGGAAASGLLLFLAHRLAAQDLRAAAGTGAFSLASACLLAASLTAGWGLVAGALPLLAASAWGLAVLAGRWDSAGARAVSYAFQAGVALGAAAAVLLAGAAPASLPEAGAAAGAALLAGAHYRWCRKRPPPLGSGFFARFDRTDDTAVVLLLSGLLLAFLALRSAVYPGIAAWVRDVPGTFQAAQSAILHVSAAALALAAVRRGDRELRAVALLVIGAAALKTLAHDLLTLGGLPLLASVSLLGASAGAIAVMLRRWPEGEEAS